MYVRAMPTCSWESDLKMYRWVILSCSLLSSGLAIFSDAGCFQMFFFLLYFPRYTHYADAFTDPALDDYILI